MNRHFTVKMNSVEKTSFGHRRVPPLFGIGLLSIFYTAAIAPPVHGQCTPQALQVAQQQLTKTLNYIDTSQFAIYTVLNSQNGYSSWTVSAANDWTTGFFAGWMWNIYEQSLDSSLLSRAQAQTASLRSEAVDASSHNLGFTIMGSYGNGYAITRDPAYLNVLQTAAKTFASLYVSFPDGSGTINSWPAYSGRVNVFIDNMPTLELLFYATQNGGNPGWQTMALNHALKSMRDLVRPDGSTYQGVEYNSDGSVFQHVTADGFSVDSTWARGQAWGLTGFTVAYRYTHDARLLATAQNLANYFVLHLPADFVPYWDFSQNDHKDSSAAAVAAAGLLELSTYVQEPTKTTYHNVGISILNSLSSSNYLGNTQSTDGILLHGAYAVVPRQIAVDTSLIWGDYYYLRGCYEAMARPPQVTGLTAANVAYNQVPLSWQAASATTSSGARFPAARTSRSRLPRF